MRARPTNEYLALSVMMNSLLGLFNTREYRKDKMYNSPEGISIHLSRLPTVGQMSEVGIEEGYSASVSETKVSFRARKLITEYLSAS